jgi:hypothetical protein
VYRCHSLSLLTPRRGRGVFWGTFFQTLEGMTEVQNPPLDRKYVPDVAGFRFKADLDNRVSAQARSVTRARAP